MYNKGGQENKHLPGVHRAIKAAIKDSLLPRLHATINLLSRLSTYITPYHAVVSDSLSYSFLIKSNLQQAEIQVDHEPYLLGFTSCQSSGQRESRIIQDGSAKILQNTVQSKQHILFLVD